MKRLRAAVGKFTLGAGHKRLASQYAADTSPIMAWVRSEMVVHRRADPGDLPPEFVLPRRMSASARRTPTNVYVEWCESHDVEPTRPAWFGRDLKTLIPKLQEGRETDERVYVYKGLVDRCILVPDPVSGSAGEQEEDATVSDCTTDKDARTRSKTAGRWRFSGHPGIWIVLPNF